MKQVQGASLVELLVSLLILSISTLPLVLTQWRMIQSLNASDSAMQAFMSMNNMSEQLLAAHAIQTQSSNHENSRAEWLSVELHQSQPNRLRLLFYWPKARGLASHCLYKNPAIYECMTREL